MKRAEAGALSLRAADPSEAELLTALARRSKAYWGYSQEFMSVCEAELTYTPELIGSPRHHFLIAETAGICVGFYTLLQLTQDDTELEALFVEPEYIGLGYGRELIEHAKVVAAASGASRLIIQSDPNAAPFYEAAGAVVTGRHLKYSRSVSSGVRDRFGRCERSITRSGARSYARRSSFGRSTSGRYCAAELRRFTAGSPPRPALIHHKQMAS